MRAYVADASARVASAAAVRDVAARAASVAAAIDAVACAASDSVASWKHHAGIERQQRLSTDLPVTRCHVNVDDGCDDAAGDVHG